MNLIFKREEQKYRVPPEAQRGLAEVLEKDFVPAEYSQGTNCSLYYDTPDHEVITESMEKPVYKEKLRLRSYGVPEEDSLVFIELKKKYKGITYKRRESLSYREALRFLNEGIYPGKDTQIMREIDWVLQQRDLRPSFLIVYDRCSYCGVKDPALRATVDRNIRYRTEDLRLDAGSSGHLVDLGGDQILEIKAEGGLPLRLTRGLRKLSLYPCSFSKFAAAYEQDLRRRGELVVPDANTVKELSSTADDAPSVWAEYLAFADHYRMQHAAAGFPAAARVAGPAGV